MRNFVLRTLFAGCFITIGLHAMESSQAKTMRPNMRPHMTTEISEDEIIKSLSGQDLNTYQQLNSQQKALVLKIAKQFSNKAHMPRKPPKMMHQGMMHDEMMPPDMDQEE